MAAAGDWPVYNGTLQGDRFSPLSQITSANVPGLRQACAFDTPDSVSFQSGLVAVAGTLYFTAHNNTYAIDGATCRQKWKQSRAEPANFLMVNRGVGYADGRLFRGTGDAHALALDAETGKVLWDVAIGDPKKGESAPIAPIAWKGLVFIGNAGGDNYAVTGRIYALDAETGRVVWQFHTVPDSGPARRTWQKASPANPPSGGATWTSYALDEDSGILYVPTGNPAPDFVEAFHPGENLYTGSLLALDARTGRLLAHLQLVPGDFHDWDVSPPPALVTDRNGRALVLAAAKDGHVYGVTRPSRGTTDSTAPGGAGLAVVFKTLATTRENAGTPLTPGQAIRFCPGSQGGMEWNGAAYHRELGLFYANAIDWCTSVRLQQLDTLKGAPGMPWTGMDHPQLAFGQQDSTSRWKGWIVGADATTGDVRWKLQMPKPMVAGLTPTAGGLLFTGDLDGNVLALDAGTGKELWRQSIGKPIGGGVISYQAGGKQHLAVAAGLNSPIWPVNGGKARVVVYALP